LLLVLALAVAPIASALAAGSEPAGAAPHPRSDNGTAKTAAAGANTPSGKHDANAAKVVGKSNDPASK
jgi:hypothetical protein